MTSERHTLSPGSRPTADVPEPASSYLDAARACILDVGWRRTTLTEVSRRAGVSRMTIYRTWPDMSALLGDLMTREWSQLLTAALPSSVEAAVGAEDIASNVAAAVVALRENELFIRIVELDPELILPYLLARRGRSQELVIGVLRAAIEAGQSLNAVRPGSPDAMARGVVLAAHGFVLSAHTMVDDQIELADLDEQLVVTVRGLLEPEK